MTSAATAAGGSDRDGGRGRGGGGVGGCRGGYWRGHGNNSVDFTCAAGALCDRALSPYEPHWWPVQNFKTFVPEGQRRAQLLEGMVGEGTYLPYGVQQYFRGNGVPEAPTSAIVLHDARFFNARQHHTACGVFHY